MSISETILELAEKRGIGKTICPSEVARTLWPEDWRRHMKEVRNTAFTLRDDGKVRITQKGKAVTGTEIKGPMRISIVD